MGNCIRRALFKCVKLIARNKRKDKNVFGILIRIDTFRIHLISNKSELQQLAHIVKLAEKKQNKALRART